MVNIFLRKCSILIIALVSLATTPATAETPVAGSYAGGDGTEGNPYQISTLAELRLLSETEADWVADTYFILTADIDATDTNTWNIGDHDDKVETADEAMGLSPIGTSFVDAFYGVFDGQDHVISNLYIRRNGYDNIGLFGFIAIGSSISNLGIENGSVKGYNYVGGLVGINYGTITSCYASASIVAKSSAGGLVGSNSGSITSSHATNWVYVWGNLSYAGGLLGVSTGDVTIETCYATGSVTGQGSYVGGLIGRVQDDTTITSCYATGNVTGGVHTGGLIGESLIAVYLIDCYATGTVSGESRVGGLVGQSHETITSSHATGDVSASSSSAGGLVGMTSSSITSSYSTGNVSGGGLVGGLVGDATSILNNIMFIEDSYATGAVSATVYSAGGLVGFSDADITRCYATGNVSGESNVGGLIGLSSGGEAKTNIITLSYATGAVSSSGGGYVGGFIGHHALDTITSCYSTGSVTEYDQTVRDIGGFVGRMANGIINSSYATGVVIATGDDVGGFAGSNNNGTINSCYWDLDTSGQANSVAGGTGLTSSQMQSQASYAVNWDFDINPDWVMIEGETRPYFPWQIPALFEGTATSVGPGFTIDTGYVHNVDGSGVILDEYGVVYHEAESSDLIYYNFTEEVLYETESVPLDGSLIDELLDDTAYWYRAYAVDSDGNIHYGTERKVTTLTAVYVDFDNGSPVGTGTEEDPVDTLSDAVILAPENGLIKIAPGTTTETITIDQPVTLIRNGESGSVIIGN